MQQQLHKLRPWIVAATALVITALPHAAFAAAPIHARLDGRELNLPVAPIIENQRTLMPMRGLLEALGASVGWNQETHTVTSTLNGATVVAQIGNTTAKVNDKAVTLEVPPRIVDGSTLIPLRFFIEAFGMHVGWEDATRTVLIDTRAAVTPPPAPISRDGSTENRKAVLALSVAQKQIGAPYTWGGTSPATGFDCSGFIQYISDQVGVDLPRTSQELFGVGMSVSKDQLQAGDLVFYNTDGSGASHVGIYDGKGGFIHAENESVGVTTTPFDKPWWAVRYLGARRVFR